MTDDRRLVKRRSIDGIWQKVAIVTSCLAIGTSVSVGAVNHNANKRSDQNTCAIKTFLAANQVRVKENGGVGAAKAISIYKNLNHNLQPTSGHCK